MQALDLTRWKRMNAMWRSTRRLRIFGGLLASALIALPGAVRASEPEPLARAGACAELEHELVQKPSANAMFELADCYGQNGRSASAWAQFREAAAAAQDGGAADLAALARIRAKALEPELSYVTVTTWRGQSLLVTRDGAPIDDAVLGTAIPLDPGSHVITASAPGKRKWSRRIELGAHADHVTVSVPVLPDDLSARPVASTAEATAPAQLAREDADSEALSVQRTLALVAGAVGIAGLATGTVFGLKAASDWSEAKARCNPYPYCGDEGVRLSRTARTSALISTIAFVSGAAGLTGGALLWFTAPQRERGAPSVGVGLGQVQLRGPL